MLPQAQRPLAYAANGESSREQAFIGQSQQESAFHAGPSNLSLPQFSHCIFVPFQVPGANANYGDRLGSVPNSELEAQKKLLEHQIEVPSVR